MNVTSCKLADIQLNSEYLRVDTDVSDLKKSIESVGLIHPLTVNPENQLLAGARRLQAVRELGWEEVPVHVVEQDALLEELISIDENLVRAPLRGLELEKSLNRGRQIYETLHPEANKVDISTDDLSTEEKQAQKERDESDESSFAAVTAEKTGLSRSVIQSAIKRDALSSESVKRARDHGELNASKANELIKLQKEAQDQILPLVEGKTVKETRRIVEAARSAGLDAAQEEADRVVPLPREYSQIMSPVRRVNRTISRILVEELRYDGPEQTKINNELITLRNNLSLYLEMVGIESSERDVLVPQPPPSAGAESSAALEPDAVEA